MIKVLNIVLATKPFLSLLYRKTLNAVVKLPPLNRKRREQWNTTEHFMRENLAYSKVLVGLNKFEKISGNTPFKLYPGLLAVNIIPHKESIVLHDLQNDGFFTLDRPTPLNFDQCNFILKNLANYHAIPIVMRHTDKDQLNGLVEDLNEITFGDRPNEAFPKIVRKTCDVFLPNLKNNDVVKKVREFDREFINVMRNICINSTLECDAAIVHGDFWISNLMFKGKVILFNYIIDKNSFVFIINP